MHKFNNRPQTGFALILFLVVLMGVGGIVLAGYTQGILKQVEESKFQHNQRVLKEAKQALLMYAYRYPTTALAFNGTSRGPGRLPCPDTNNSGTPNSTAFCINVNALVGRFPWNANGMEFYDARDADGESLWYAVSRNYANSGPPIINSDIPGTITLVDQSENIIYDGNGAGIAAVIIAPGPSLAGQDRIADPNNAANYLDSNNGFDNSAFNNGESDTNDDGFILGPVYDQAQNINVINDQMIVITAAEVIEVAEKAVLQAYRTSINEYLTLTGGVYPWLYNYAGVPDVPGLSSYYPADVNFVGVELATNLDNFGRIPSIFGDYFTESNSRSIETELGGSISWAGPATVNGYLFLDGPPTLNLPIPNKLADVSFGDIDPDIVGKDGRLTATLFTPETLPYDIYFWEYDHNEPYNGGWSLCAAPANQLSDCSRDSSLNPTPGGPNDADLDIIHLVVTLDFTGVVDFNMDYTNAPVIAPPVAADGTAHASITGTYAGADIISLPFLSATYERDEHYHAGESALDPTDGSYVTGTLNMNDFGQGPLSLVLRYYPELPAWAFDNVWHDSVMMAYAENYRPDILGACTEGTDCIQINSLAGNNDNKIAILTLAGQHNWDDDLDSNFINDLPTIFDTENADILDIDGTEYLFDRNEAGGNDVIMIVTECTTC